MKRAGFEMQLTGILRTWNDDRGFGFIAPTHGGAELFVHISAFPRDGTRPTAGERLAYELGRGPHGKPQAVNVIRLAFGTDRPPKTSRRRATESKPSVLGSLVLVAVMAVAGAWGYQNFSASQHRRELAAQPVTSPSVPMPAPSAATFRCDGRTSCSQMTSCAEATWFINNCPGTRMDGNSDGVPCEQQWCTGPAAR